MFKLMKAWQPKVDGNRYENSFQNPGKAVVGQLKPVRNTHTGDINRNSRKADSRRVTKVVQVIEKKMHTVTNKASRMRMSWKRPRCGKPNIAGTIQHT